MALADIIERIDADAESEAAELIADAEARAAALNADADAVAKKILADSHAAAEREAGRMADTIVVNARLAARDRAVTARRVLVDEALSAAAEKLSVLSDAEYAAFLGAKIAAAARGGETLSLGSADAKRLDAIVAAVREIAPHLGLMVSDAPAPFERGAMLHGERVSADLSLPALVAERRDDLELVIMQALANREA